MLEKDQKLRIAGFLKNMMGGAVVDGVESSEICIPSWSKWTIDSGMDLLEYVKALESFSVKQFARFLDEEEIGGIDQFFLRVSQNPKSFSDESDSAGSLIVQLTHREQPLMFLAFSRGGQVSLQGLSGIGVWMTNGAVVSTCAKDHRYISSLLSSGFMPHTDKKDNLEIFISKSLVEPSI